MKRGPANNLFIEQQSVIKLAAWVVKHTNIMSMNFLLSLELIQISTFNSLNKKNSEGAIWRIFGMFFLQNDCLKFYEFHVRV